MNMSAIPRVDTWILYRDYIVRPTSVLMQNPVLSEILTVAQMASVARIPNPSALNPNGTWKHETHPEEGPGI